MLVASMRKLIYFLSLLIYLAMSIYLRRTATSNKRYYFFIIFDILSVAQMFWPVDDDYITASTRSLGTQIFSQDMRSFKIFRHLHTLVMSAIPKASSGEKFLQPVASARTAKWTTSAAVALHIYLICPAGFCYLSIFTYVVFTKSVLQCLSPSVHDCFSAQMWYQGECNLLLLSLLLVAAANDDYLNSTFVFLVLNINYFQQ